MDRHRPTARVSVCSAIGGIAIDAAGPPGAMLLAVGTAVLALIVAVVFRGAQPDLRGGISVLD